MGAQRKIQKEEKERKLSMRKIKLEEQKQR